jgi:hypothetical protein
MNAGSLTKWDLGNGPNRRGITGTQFFHRASIAETVGTVSSSSSVGQFKLAWLFHHIIRREDNASRCTCLGKFPTDAQSMAEGPIIELAKDRGQWETAKAFHSV